LAETLDQWDLEEKVVKPDEADADGDELDKYIALNQNTINSFEEISWKDPF